MRADRSEFSRDKWTAVAKDGSYSLTSNIGGSDEERAVGFSRSRPRVEAMSEIARVEATVLEELPVCCGRLELGTRCRFWRMDRAAERNWSGCCRETGLKVEFAEHDHAGNNPAKGSLQSLTKKMVRNL